MFLANITFFCSIFFILFLSLFGFLTTPHVVDDPIITLHHGGQVKGSIRYSNIMSKEYHSFKGIPYAEPPVGDLRFKGTVPHKGWIGVKEATQHGDVCPQPKRDGTTAVIGAEDCLFLNVYVPKNQFKEEKYPVMVYIHGGAFYYSSGNQEELNPESLIAEDVVVVQINYRLGFLGFFSTGDRNSPGNYGVKDSLEAMKWVQSNIEAFGGDRHKVTLFGESAGGMITHYLLLSPLSKGLFHQALSMSGTAITSTAFQEFPRTKAFEVAREMNITFESTEELMKKLREIEDPKTFVEYTPPQIGDEDVPKGKVPPTFTPCIEPEDSLEPRVIPEHPLRLLLKGNYMDIPYIITITDEELLSAIIEVNAFPTLFEFIEEHPETLLPYTWKIEPNSIEASEYLQRIYKLYFNNNPIEDVYDYTHFVSDSINNYGPYKTARLQKQNSPMYFATFSFTGDLNHYKIKNNLTEYIGAVHADDLPYLFLSPKYPEVTEDNPAYEVRARMVRMWTNFAKFGDPTKNLDELVNVKWTAMMEGRFVYMNIGRELKMDKDPFGERMQEWWEMDKKFN